MDALDDLWPYKGAFRNDPLERYHVVQVNGAQRPGIAGEFTKAADKGAVVYLCVLACCGVYAAIPTTCSADSFGGRFGRAVMTSFSALSKHVAVMNGSFRRLHLVRRCNTPHDGYKPIREFSIMRSYFVDADLHSISGKTS
jgi:hypothetical protein